LRASGTLPEIDTVELRMNGVEFSLTMLSLASTCVYAGSLALISNSNVFEGVRQFAHGFEGIGNRSREGPFGFLCPGQVHTTEESLTLSRTIFIELT
jgi:hypothetical protein